jgi:hypothetical protein
MGRPQRLLEPVSSAEFAEINWLVGNPRRRIMFTFEALRERQEFWQHLPCLPGSLFLSTPEARACRNLFRR